MPATPKTLIELATAPSEVQAGIIQSVLNDAGIESWTQRSLGLDAIGLGTLGIAISTISVRAEDADRARAALDANRQDSVDIDWAEVNVGEPEDESAAAIAAVPESRRIETRRVNSNWLWTITLFACGVVLWLSWSLSVTLTAALVMIVIFVVSIMLRGRV